MFKNKIFGMFGKKGDDKKGADGSDQPLISDENVTSEIDADEDAVENPEDIISKLAQIDSIIGDDDDEDEGEHDVEDISDFFAGDEDESQEAEVQYEEAIEFDDAEEEEQGEPEEQLDVIRVKADVILKVLPPETLSASADELAGQYANSADFVFTFERGDVMHGLGIGKVEMSIGDLVNRISLNVFADDVASTAETKVELPIMGLLPLVPPAWFALGAQDTSKQEMVEDMEDLFPGLEIPKPDEAVAEAAPEQPEPEAAPDAEVPAETVDIVPTAEEISIASENTLVAGVEVETEPEEAAAAPALDQPDVLEDATPAIPETEPVPAAPVADAVSMAPPSAVEPEPPPAAPVANEAAPAQPPEEVAETEPEPAISPSPAAQKPEVAETSFDSGMPATPPRPVLSSEPPAPAPPAVPPPPPVVEEPVAEESPSIAEEPVAEEAHAVEELPETDLQEPAAVAEPPPAPAAPPAPPVTDVPVADDAPAVEELPDTVAEAPTAVPEPPAPPAAPPAPPVVDEPVADEVPDSLAKEPAVVAEPPAAPPAPQITETPLVEPVADVPVVPMVTAVPAAVAEEPVDAELASDDDTIIKETEEAAEAYSEIDAMRDAAEKLLVGDEKPEPIAAAEKSVAKPTAAPAGAPEWRSQAPNGIDINRSGIEELCLLTSVGEHVAQTIIDYRTEHGHFQQLQDLKKVPGLGSHSYRKIAKLGPTTDVRNAELHLNKLLSIDSESVSLNKVVAELPGHLNLNAVFVSSIDGLVLAKKAASDDFLKLTDALAAAAPQLYKRGKKALKQAQLPTADMFTFYVGKNAVTFAGSDQVFLIYVHKQKFPSPKDLTKCHKIARELVWYCAYRAVIS